MLASPTKIGPAAELSRVKLALATAAAAAAKAEMAGLARACGGSRCIGLDISPLLCDMGARPEEDAR